jgi:deoxycytidine triphosphate deaminase
MSVIANQELTEYFSKGLLIRNPRYKSKEVFDIEVASYDLMAGEAIWKDEGKKVWEKRTGRCSYDEGKDMHKQKTVTLKPGQMMFVVTHEDVCLPKHIYATVYSRNKLSRDGILALNAGHIDPGFQGPIIIRLINLKSTNYTLQLGDRTINEKEGHVLSGHHQITRAETIQRAIRQADDALGNALYDLALLREFVKKDEFGQALGKWLFKSVAGILTLIIAAIGVAASVVNIYEFFKK